MACLTQTQIDNIFTHIGSYFKSLKDPKDYNHLDHFKYLYNLGVNKGIKPETSLSFVQVLPNLVDKYLTITNTRVSIDEALTIKKLSYDFENFSLEQIAESIGQIKQPDVVSTEEEPVIKEEEIEANESLPLYTALTSLVLSTTLNEKLDINELEKDLDKVWHHEFNRELLSRTVSATEGAFNTTLNGHRGFRLKAVKMSSIPFDELYNSIKGDRSEEEVKAILDKNNAIALVVTDNDGNLLRFDQTYTKNPNGKLVYFNMRDTKYDLLDSTDARGRIQSIADIAKNYNISVKDAEEQIKKEVEKLRNIQKAVFEDKPVLFEITGGTKGYIPSIVRPTGTKDWYGIAPSTYGDIVDSFGVTPIELVTEGEFKGKLMVYLNEGKLPVLLLNRNITDAEALEYASAVHKFLNENNHSSGAVNTAATFLSQYIAFNQAEKVSLEQFLFNKLNTPESIAQMIVKKPDSNFNRFLTYQANQSIYYTIADGSIKQATLNEYQDQWRDKLRTLLVKSQNGKIEQFSSSLSFEPTSESRNIVNGIEEVKEEKKNTAIIFGGVSRNLEDFLKERNITSAATKKQIEEAFEWYKSSPLSKVIPFTTMFDVVNSTAKASFGKEGIKLFFGANYTDLYHESWHGFSQLFLSKSDKVNLYEELRKLSGSFVLPNGVRVNYKDASYRQLEEVLAEDFRLYKLSGGKKVLGQRPIRNKFFRAIFDFLNWLFDGVSFNQARTDFNSIKKVHDLFKKLDIGDIKEYKASDKNSLFTSLASPIGISTDTPLNETESTEVSESMDSIISDLMFQFAEQNGVSIFGDFLGSKKSIKNVYGLIKETLEKKVDELNEDVEANDRAIFILNTALNNFGNIDEIIDKGNLEGDTTIQYHLRRSKVLDFKNKEFDDENKEESSDFVTKKDQADQGELSFEELANEKVLFLIRTLKAYKLENGKYVPEKNNLGFSKLTNYRKTLGNVINIVSNNTGAISIYNKLNEAKNKPEIQELLMKLGKIEPNTDIDSKSTFNSWVLFANSFNTTKLPMLITIIETAEDSKPKIYNVDASSDITSERSRMISRYKTNIYNTKYATMNSDKNEMMLDIKKLSEIFEPVFGVTAKKTEANKQEAAFYLFAAIGLPLNDKLYEQYFDKDKNLNRDIVKNATYVYRELKNFYDRNTSGKLKNNMIPDHIDLLTNGLGADSDFLTQKTVIDNLLYLHIKVADVVSSFSLLNAEGNREYENVLNSQITITQNNINESRTLEELYNKPGFEHFNPANNPMIKASQVFKRLFANGVRQTDFNIRKFSGIQSIEDGYFTNGQSTIETDPVSKFYLEFYSYLTTGFTSNPTPSDKKTYLGFFVTGADGDNRFIKPNAFTDGTALGDKALEDIMFDYLKAEHERVYDLNSNTYPELARLGFFSNYGKEFLVFDNVLLPETKERLKALSPKKLLEDANQELVSRAKNEIIEYINKLTDQNYEVFQKIDFIDDEVLKKATKQKGKFNSAAYSKNIVKAFSANTFIQYIESTIMFYGDIAAYDLIKEDFHKRDSASGSTGRTMITDPQFIRAYNKFYGSEYGKSQGFDNSFNEDGYINTAVFQDHKYENKALMAEYEKSWRKVYTEEFKKLKFNAKQIKEKVDFLIEKQLAPYKQDEVKEGDAQGWVTLDSYRFFSILLNEWSPAHEDIYNKIVKNESVDQAEVLKVFSPKKFQFYGPLKTSKYHVNVLHKFSLLPLIPNVIQGKNIDILHKRMMRENVQYATFISGSKIATLRNENNELDKFYSDPSTRMMDNSPLTKNIIHLRYLRNQVPINDYYKNRVVFSTQLRALIYNDLFNKGVPLSKNIDALVNKYIQSIEDYVEAAKDELKQEINFNSTDGTYDVKKLAKIIKKELDRRDIPDHLQIAATSANEDGFTYDMSLARNANDIEKILFSIANKRIVKRKINGEPLIQVAGSGFESQRATNPTKEQVEEYKGDDLLFYRKDPITGENLPMQVKVALQGKFKNLLGLTHPDGNKINTRQRLNQALKNKEWRDKHKEMLQLMAVRIPVQGHNSMEYMEVAEFLPEVAGPIIILPSYIVAKAGSDYDIDKLSVFFPNIEKAGKRIFLSKFDSSIKESNEQIKNNIDSVKNEIKLLKDQIQKEFENLKKEKEFNKLDTKEKEIINTLYSNYNRIKNEYDVLITRWTSESILAGKGKTFSNDILNLENDIDNKYQELNVAEAQLKINLKQYYSAFSTEKKQQFWKSKEPQVEALYEQLSDLKVKLINKSASSLENDLIRNLINIISTDEVFEMMKKPNGTYLVQDFANDMTKYFETDYNPKQSFKDWNRSTVSSISPKFKVSPTNIFEIQYNIYKQNANSVGKRALGIGANVNKIKALFNQIDFQFNKEYIHTRYSRKKKKYEEQLREIRILLNHNSNKDGSISLSSLYNTEGIKISDYLNQLMNGWLDVAKDPWIFYVMGTPELTPALLYLVSAGTPFEEAVYFLAQPVIRKYIEDVKKLDSPISKLDETFKDPYEFTIQARMLGLGREANGHTLWERQMSLINLELQRTENQLFTKDYLQSKLDDSLTGPLEYSREDQAILAHFFEINDGAKAIARVQQSFNFDTKTSSTLFETFKRGQKRDILIEDVEFEVNYSKMFPKEKLKSLYEDTILGKFDITDVQTNVFGGLFPIRNNPQLNEYLYNIYSNNIFFGSQFDDKIKKFLGDPEKFVSEFKNDFTTAMLLKMLYDFKIEDNQYKGLEIQTITRDVDIRDLGLLEEPESEFNPNKLFFATKNYTKDTPSQYPKFGFIFTENLEMLGTDKNVSTTQAIIRTDKEGNINRNALAIVTKKEQAANKFFEDTDEDFDLFKTTNAKLIDTIANSNFERIIVPTGGFAMEKAKLPTRFAEWLQNELQNKLGIETDLVDRGSGYSGLSNPKKFDKPTTQPSTESIGFQGYKGGFEDKGKGTPEGDGKDKAMRQVADGAIVEFKTDKVDSSSFTTLNYFDGTYSYEKDRYIGEAFIGDSFKGFSNKIIMLARNGKFAGTSLNDETKRSIKRAFDRGVEFVVGDMPGVDSQFIDYLQEIGAKFTIYHTGDTSRIQVKQPTTQPTKQEKGKKEPKFIATGVFIKDDKIYLDINTLNNIYNQLDSNLDTVRDINGVGIKYPPKKAFRSFTEFVNYSLEKEYLRNILSDEDVKAIAIRMNNFKVDIASKLNNSPIKVVNEFNLSDNKKLFEIFKTGGVLVDSSFGLNNLVDTTTGKTVLSNFKIKGTKVTEYEIDESKFISDAVETYLMDKALKNINNVYSYTQHIGLDYPTQLSELIRAFPSLRSQYLLPNLFTTRKIKNSRSKQLILNQGDLDPGMISILHEEYLDLSDPGLMKVEDPALNQYISDIFKQLSTYALLTEGFSKQGAFSLSEVVGQKDLLEIGTFNNINEYVNGSLSKTLDSNGKAKYENFLNSFAYKFFRNRLGLSLNERNEWSFNRSYLNTNKDYLIEDYQVKPLVPENIENFKYLSKFSDNYYIVNVNSVINDSKTSSDKKFKSSTLTEYANMFSDVTFIYDTDTMKNLGLKALTADNIKVVNSPEALMKLNISGPIALPSNGLNPAFNEAIANKFGILNLGQRDISKNATLTDIINSDSLLVTSDIVNLIRAKAISVLDELKNSCNL
jgi:hypothetical protein